MIRYDASCGPHSHSGVSTPRLMVAVLLALCPATLLALAMFGLPALLLWFSCCASAVATEALCLRLANRPLTAVFDGSALLTGWLLALSLPPACSPLVGGFGAFCAIALAKQVYGGLGHNLFNPAMAARVLLLISFPVAMTDWSLPNPAVSQWLGSDAITGATPLGLNPPSYPLWTLWLGTHGGSLGETSSLLLLLGGLVLIGRRLIAWDTPLAVILGAALPAAIGHLLAPADFVGPLPTLFSGGLLLCAFFIATDPVTSPVTRSGRLLFGAGIGLLTWLIRQFGNTPEGVAFAVVVFNAITPLIDLWLKPQPFGSAATRAKEVRP